jgi:hypothetical protein
MKFHSINKKLTDIQTVIIKGVLYSSRPFVERLIIQGSVVDEVDMYCYVVDDCGGHRGGNGLRSGGCAGTTYIGTRVGG